MHKLQTKSYQILHQLHAREHRRIRHKLKEKTEQNINNYIYYNLWIVFVANLSNWKTHCEDHSSLSSITAVHMNYFIYTYIISLLTGRYELNKLTLLPMCGFIAQLVEHRTGIAEVTGSDPVEVLIFFRLLLFSYLNWKTHCEDHSSLSSITAVHMNYFIYTYIISLLTGRYELNKLTSLPMCGFIAQLVEHRTGIAEVTGSNPVEALIFSGFFFPVA